jgi:metal-responsive CopG/Arc/MetJ family transcriptional regulator
MKSKLNREAEKRRKGPSRVPITVRLPEYVVKRIDKEIDGRDVPVSRNNWFLEAVIEKLRRNGSGEHDGAQ